MTDRPRQERWQRTRGRIVDAALEVLVEHGYAGMTMQRVQDRAGVSRGALTHQFGSMAELAAAAVEAVADRQTTAISHELSRNSAAATVEELVDAVLAALRQRTFAAGLDLWCAARSDEALREALLPGARRIARTYRQLTAEVLGLDPASTDARLAADGLLSLLRGLALGAVLRSHGDAEREAITTWLTLFQDRARPPRRAHTATPTAGGIE